MKNLITLVTLLALSFPLAAQMDTLVPSLLRQADIPGLSLAIIDQGRLSYSGAFGVKSSDTREPVGKNTVFAAASLSKPVFAYAVLQWVEQGKFDLDKPLFEYLPYPDIEYDSRYRKITARMALSHSTGFPNWRNDSLRILFTPGERFSYSGEGFVYLQRVIEKLSGRKINEWVKEQVFQPLGMTRTSYLWHAGLEDDFAAPHNELGRSSSKYKPEEGNAAHSLQTTAEDYARFLLAIINGKGLKEATIREMLKPQVVVPLRFGQPDTRHQRMSWGLGWGLDDTPNGRVFWHWGDNGTFKCFIAANRDKKTAIVFFTNSSNGLMIAPALLAASPVGSVAASSWLSYGTPDQPAHRLLKDIITVGYDKAIQPYLMPGRSHHDTARINEVDMNRLGYVLLRQKNVEDARKVFWSNVQAYPYSANVYDSYGEACLVGGRFEEAAENYRKALEKNPGNETAKVISEQLSRPLKGELEFRLEQFADARVVSLSGEFNGWSDIAHIMRWQNGAWVVRLDLKPGKYRYKFLVDGVDIVDPANPKTVYVDGRHYSVWEK